MKPPPIDPTWGGPESLRMLGSGRGERVYGAQGAPHQELADSEASPEGFDQLVLGSMGVRAFAVLTVRKPSEVVTVQILSSASGDLLLEMGSDELLNIARQAEAYLQAGRRYRP